MRITVRIFLDEEQQQLVAKDTQLCKRIAPQFGNDLDVNEPVFERFLQVMARSKRHLSCNACWMDWDGKDLAAASHFEVRAAKEMHASERELELNRALLEHLQRGAAQPARMLRPFRFKVPKVAGNAVLSLVGTNELVVGTVARRAFAKLEGLSLAPILHPDGDRPHDHCWQLWSQTLLAPAFDDGTARRCLHVAEPGKIERIGWLTYEHGVLAKMADFARTAEAFGAHGEPGWLVSHAANESYGRAELSEWWLRPVLVKGSEQQQKYAALWAPALERLVQLEALGAGARPRLDVALDGQMSSAKSAGAAARIALEVEQMSARASTRELPPEPDPVHSNDYYANRFERAGLGRVWPALVPHLRSEIVMAAESVMEKQLRLGTSKVGGRPDLPAGQVWPRDAAGAPLGFLAQVNLAELAGMPGVEALPPKGMLSFFYAAGRQPWGFDPKDRDGFRVLYSDGGKGKLKRMGFPKELEDHERFGACQVTFTGSVKLPDYGDVQEVVGEEGYAAYVSINAIAARSKLLGWPDQLQGTMEEECELASSGIYCGDGTERNTAQAMRLAEHVSHWRLLLQVRSEREANMYWGDDGDLYFWIREEDLQQRRFERCWVILQCR